MSDPALAASMALVQRFEGCVLHPYRDVTGTWTIGWGSLVMPDGSHVSGMSRAIGQSEADQMLAAAVGATLKAVRGMISVPVSDNQAAALCSLAYNIGTGGLRSSIVMTRLNQGNFTSAAADFLLFTQSKGKYIPGLYSRRQAEVSIFNAPGAARVQIAEKTSDDFNAAELKTLQS